jgi:YbbR domain-containing protein
MSRLLDHLPAKLLALLAAGLLWFQLRGNEPLTERTLLVPLNAIGLDNSRLAANLPQQVRVRVRGPARLVEGDGLSTLTAYIDLSEVSEGAYLRPVRVELPSGVRAIGIEPARLEGKVERYETKPLRVQVQSAGSLVEPEMLNVEARGPASVVQAAKVALGYADEDSTEVSLIAIDGSGQPISGLSLTPDKVNISGRSPYLIEKTVTLVLEAAPSTLRIVESDFPTEVNIIGSPAALSKLETVRIRPQYRTGQFQQTLNPKLPPGVRLATELTGTLRVERVQ